MLKLKTIINTQLRLKLSEKAWNDSKCFGKHNVCIKLGLQICAADPTVYKNLIVLRRPAFKLKISFCY